MDNSELADLVETLHPGRRLEISCLIKDARLARMNAMMVGKKQKYFSDQAKKLEKRAKQLALKYKKSDPVFVENLRKEVKNGTAQIF